MTIENAPPPWFAEVLLLLRQYKIKEVSVVTPVHGVVFITGTEDYVVTSYWMGWEINGMSLISALFKTCSRVNARWSVNSSIHRNIDGYVVGIQIGYGVYGSRNC